MNNENYNLESFEIWGTGTPLREFLHVDDLVDGIIFINEKNIQDYLINIEVVLK